MMPRTTEFLTEFTGVELDEFPPISAMTPAQNRLTEYFEAQYHDALIR
jgi:hypothetical protein